MTSPATLLRALAFAADRHRDQRRKGKNKSPYINHPIAVAEVLAGAGKVTNEALLVAAILHDTVEDTKTTPAELRRHFGADVAGLVREVTDDKSLPKQVRKRLQIEHAAGTSPRGKLLKIADKICNLRELGANPPPNWPLKRRLAYVTWAQAVVANCRGSNAGLDAEFDKAVRAAKRSLKASS